MTGRGVDESRSLIRNKSIPGSQTFKLRMIFLIAFLFTGCDQMVLYHFKILNLTNSTLLVSYSTSNEEHEVEILSNEEMLIYQRKQTNSHVKPYFKENQIIWWFLTFHVENSNGSAAKGDLREVNRWAFSKMNDVGVYELQLTDNDF